MKKGIVGKKIGMTQIFAEDGRLIPVTVIEAGPCPVVQKKTVEKDGYEIDGVSGATYTSEGVMNAAKDALGLFDAEAPKETAKG